MSKARKRREGSSFFFFFPLSSLFSTELAGNGSPLPVPLGSKIDLIPFFRCIRYHQKLGTFPLTPKRLCPAFTQLTSFKTEKESHFHGEFWAWWLPQIASQHLRFVLFSHLSFDKVTFGAVNLDWRVFVCVCVCVCVHTVNGIDTKRTVIPHTGFTTVKTLHAWHRGWHTIQTED